MSRSPLLLQAGEGKPRQEKDSPTISFRNIPPGIVQKHLAPSVGILTESANVTRWLG